MEKEKFNGKLNQHFGGFLQDIRGKLDELVVKMEENGKEKCRKLREFELQMKREHEAYLAVEEQTKRT